MNNKLDIETSFFGKNFCLIIQCWLGWLEKFVFQKKKLLKLETLLVSVSQMGLY